MAKLLASFWSWLFIVFAAIILVAFAWLDDVNEEQIQTQQTSNDSVLVEGQHSLISPLPTSIVVDEAKASLGRALFFDTQLSVNDSLSCASCHKLTAGGDDDVQTSVGLHGVLLARNSPSIFNAKFNVAQFWDGRAASLSEQIDHVVNAENEFGWSWPELVERLQQNEFYQGEFANVYGRVVTEFYIKDALSHFVETLITPNSRFDQYLLGDESAITAAELAGYRRFQDLGCIACHQGINVGGNLFQPLGVFVNRRNKVSSSLWDDLGRYAITGNDNDKHVFKVPSLRNVAMTSPYFHNGSVATLSEAIGVMGNLQLGRNLSADEIASLELFLRTLTGELPEYER